MTLTKEQAEHKLIECLPEDIKILLSFFEIENKKLFLVGGCIRDVILNKQPKDFDVCTDALPGTVIKILEKYGIQYELRGEHFAVVVAKMKEGEYEIATFREDVKYENNRHPEVRLGVTISDDVKRRDFTINALFMDLHEKTIIDLVGGINDIYLKTVRCVGTPNDRFNEDHLRKLRAIRFASRLNFSIEDNTFTSIYNNPDLNISGERIVGELLNCFEKTHSVQYLLNVLYSSRLVHQIFRGLLINDLSDIDVNKITSFNTFLASIICPCNTNIAEKLVNLNFKAKTANSVEFLLSNLNIIDVLPLKFFNKRKSTDLTDSEISIYNNETNAVKWLVEFQPDTELSSKLQNEGFKGEQLGKKIQEHYQNAFISAIN